MEKDWKLFDTYIGLYKFYWELALKLVVFTLGISGAISAYVIKNHSQDYMAYALLIPCIFSIFLAWLSHISTPGMQFAQNEVQRLANVLEIDSVPTFNSLLRFMFISKVIFSSVAVGLVSLLFILI